MSITTSRASIVANRLCQALALIDDSSDPELARVAGHLKTEIRTLRNKHERDLARMERDWRSLR